MNLSTVNSDKQVLLNDHLSSLRKFINSTSFGFMSRTEVVLLVLGQWNNPVKYNCEEYMLLINNTLEPFNNHETICLEKRLPYRDDGWPGGQCDQDEYKYIDPETGELVTVSEAEMRRRILTLVNEDWLDHSEYYINKEEFARELILWINELAMSFLISQRARDLLSQSNQFPDPAKTRKPDGKIATFTISKAVPALSDLCRLPVSVKRKIRPAQQSALTNMYLIYSTRDSKEEKIITLRNQHIKALGNKFCHPQAREMILNAKDLEAAYIIAKNLVEAGGYRHIPVTGWHLQAYLSKRNRRMKSQTYHTTTALCLVDGYKVSSGAADVIALATTANYLAPLDATGCLAKEAMTFERVDLDENPTDEVLGEKGYTLNQYVEYSMNTTYGAGGQQAGNNPSGGAVTNEERRVKAVEYLRSITAANNNANVDYYEVHKNRCDANPAVTVRMANGETVMKQLNWGGRYFGLTTQAGRAAGNLRFQALQKKRKARDVIVIDEAMAPEDNEDDGGMFDDLAATAPAADETVNDLNLHPHRNAVMSCENVIDLNGHIRSEISYTTAKARKTLTISEDTRNRFGEMAQREQEKAHAQVFQAIYAGSGITGPDGKLSQGVTEQQAMAICQQRYPNIVNINEYVNKLKTLYDLGIQGSADVLQNVVAQEFLRWNVSRLAENRAIAANKKAEEAKKKAADAAYMRQRAKRIRAEEDIEDNE